MVTPRGALFLALGALSFSCSDSESPPRPAEPIARSDGAGPAVDKVPKAAAFYSVAVVFLPRPKTDAEALVRELAAGLEVDLQVVTELDQKPDRTTVHVEMIGREEYEPPDEDTLRFKARGLSAEQADLLQRTEAAFLLGFFVPDPQQLPVLLNVSRLVYDLAVATGGLIHDLETREVFSTESWRQRRLEAGWNGNVPDARKHITIHGYQDGDLYRAISLGMVKFGCPDIVVNQFPRSYFESVGSLINLTAQTLVEGDEWPAGDSFLVDIDAIGHEQVRNSLVESLEEGALRRADLTIAPGKREEGDPDNPLIEITFSGIDGETLAERQSALIDTLFGSRDSVEYVDHDAAIKKASAAARRVLIEDKKPLFLETLPPGEKLLVKGPFETPDGGNEWMWVEVTRWENETLQGVLMNDPFHIPDLRSGATVRLEESEVFDYMHYKADGTVEGNATGDLISRKARSGK